MGFFYCLNRDCNGYVPILLYIGLLQMEPMFIPGVYNRWDFYYWWVGVAKKHLKIKGTRNFYFKTIGYCCRTKVKSSLILRRFYATWHWALTLGLKCYYVWELYHAWAPARSTMGLVWINKIWAKTKTIQVHLLLYQSSHVCVSQFTMIHCVKCFWEI